MGGLRVARLTRALFFSNLSAAFAVLASACFGGAAPIAPIGETGGAASSHAQTNAPPVVAAEPGPCNGPNARHCIARFEEAREASAASDVSVGDLAKAYVAGNLDDETRAAVIKLLSEAGDPDASSAFAKAFADYGTTKNDDDVKYAAQGTMRLAQLGRATDRGLVDALWDCFARFRPSKARSINLVKDLHGAVLAVKDKSYGPKAVTKLSAPVTDPKDAAQGLDELQFWQVTSAQLIGELGYAPGVKALVTVLLTPTKRDLAFVVRLALTRMPNDAEPVLVSALDGTDPELAALGKRYPESGHVPLIAEPLAAISRKAGYEAIHDALAKAPNDQNRTMLALSLLQFASSARSTKAYLGAYAKLATNATIPLLGGALGRAILAQASASFFDPSLTDWLLKETASAKGEAADAMTPGALLAAIKLMTQPTSKAVGAAVKKLPGEAVEKTMYKSALAVLDSCKKDAACYVGILDTPVPSSPAGAKMGHIKAAWMAAVYGDSTTKASLVSRVGAVDDDSVRSAMLDAIAHLAPQGDVASAEKLEAIAAADTSAGRNHASRPELVRVALKLRSRVP